MELKGEVTAVIYQNEINSYLVAEMYIDDEENDKEELITIVGYMPFVTEGDTIKVIGKYVEHKEYGRQFKVDTFEKLMPETLDALERYLGNGMIKGVGEVTAERIVEKFGKDTINIIKNKPLELAKIKGISMKKAIEISESFTQNWEVWQIVGLLEKFGIGANNSKRVYDKLGSSAIEQIEANPYILIDIVRGVDFKQVDRMALDLGIEYNNEKRIRSGIKYALIRITYNGHCCTLKENLIEYVRTLLDVSIDEIEDSIINLKARGEIIEEERENGEVWVYLETFYNTEQNIRNKVISLNKAKNMKKIKNIEDEIEKEEKYSSIKLSDKQIEAVKIVNDNNISIITGGPGTGKTTIIRTIIQIYKSKGNKIVLCAPTGRAAKRMTDTTGEEACTLHRLLEIGKFDEDMYFKENQEYQGMPIDADLIIVDETSMVDLFLMNYLLSSIYQGTKLILVGDSDQLPSVGPGSVLKDFINSNKIATIHLDKVFRQAAKSKIVVNAHRVNDGIGLIRKEEVEKDSKDDFFSIYEENQEKILQLVLSLCTGRLQSYGDYDFFNNIQVLTPTKKGLLGTKELNIYLQQALNPPNPKKKEKQTNGVTFRVGDRIMQIKNNYDIEWKRDITENEKGNGIFNGEIGTITDINNENKVIEIKFDDEKVAWYEFSDLEQIEHSYSITIHKAQGSEFNVVIMVVPKTAPILLTRNLLYTGITRARELLILIGAKQTIDFMMQNIDSKKRNTGLCYKLKNG